MAYIRATSLARFLNQLRALLNKKEYAVLFALIVYMVIAIGSYPFAGAPIFAVSVFPAAVIGMHGGIKSGIYSGPAILLINWVLFFLLDTQGSFGQFIAMGALIGAIATSTVSVGIGYISSLNNRLHHEISGREQAQRELNTLNQKLEYQTQQALQARSHFLTAMSHKLRTPLNASVGIHTLLLDTELDTKQSHYIHDLQRSNDEVVSIINSILEYTKVESGEIELNEVDFDLTEQLDQLQCLVQSKVDEQSVDLHIEIDPSVPQLLNGDRKKLHLILHNLVNNALDATENGSITVRASSSQPHNLDGDPATGNTMHVTFDVVDTGMGIAPKVLEGIFEPFENSYQTTTRTGVGAGIGLALCHRLCQSMDGEIRVQSVLGEGTTITVTLPFKPAAVPNTQNLLQPNQTPDQSAERPQTNPKILLAEDNMLNAKVALKLLEKLGYAAKWVKDGQEAVEAASQFTFDLILMDIQMPRLDGLEATKEIRKQYETSNQSARELCIIALTADTTLEDFSKQKAYGFDGFIGKPMSVNVLENALNEVFYSPQLVTS